MRKILIIALALLLAGAADAQVVRSGSRQKQIRIKAPRGKKNHRLDLNAIGPQFGFATVPLYGSWDEEGICGGLSYQRELDPNRRLELHLNIANHASYLVNESWGSGSKNYDAESYFVGATGFHQWMLYTIEGFSAYCGAGGSLGFGDGYRRKDYFYDNGYLYSWSDGDIHEYKSYDGLSLGIAAQVGIEYRFRWPLILSFDIRQFLNEVGFEKVEWLRSYNFGIRYTF